MRFPDSVTVIRRGTAADEYGNPGSWADATETTKPGFFVRQPQPGTLQTSYGLVLMPPASGVLLEDRLRIDGVTFEVGSVSLARSASAAKLLSVTVKPLAAQP